MDAREERIVESAQMEKKDRLAKEEGEEQKKKKKIKTKKRRKKRSTDERTTRKEKEGKIEIGREIEGGGGVVR